MKLEDLKQCKDHKDIMAWAVKFANSKGLIRRHVAFKDNRLVIYYVDDKGKKKYYDENGKQIKNYVRLDNNENTYDRYDWKATKINLCKRVPMYIDQVDKRRKKQYYETKSRPQR